MKEVLTTQERAALKRLRTRLRAAAPLTRVSFRRRQYRISLPKYQRLARWADADSAITRLAKHVDKHGSSPIDRKRAWVLIAMLEDVFDINTQESRP